MPLLVPAPQPFEDDAIVVTRVARAGERPINATAEFRRERGVHDAVVVAVLQASKELASEVLPLDSGELEGATTDALLDAAANPLNDKRSKDLTTPSGSVPRCLS